MVTNDLCITLFFQTAPPEQRYSSQLEQLAMMGFVDRDANIRGMLSLCFLGLLKFVGTSEAALYERRHEKTCLWGF